MHKVIIAIFMSTLLSVNIAFAEGGYFIQKPNFSGCFENYLSNLVTEASIAGKAEGEHMGYDISMIRYDNNQQCIVDIAIYSGQTLVDRRMVRCTN